ncbi:DNA polymerase III subunit beta [Candidatus Babeliales bacterium]|nr:DNA polymerase III subunit beta [Candidatus Babeliales bacterium]
MKNSFKVDQKVLVGLLSSMQPICSKKTTLDVTESILFQIMPRELILKSTDLEISLQSSVSIESNLEETATFLISGKRIFELVKEIDGEIEFVIAENHLRLKAQGVDLQLNIRPSQDFPPFPERIENLMQVDSSFLLSMIGKVSFVVPHNHSNNALNGVLFECNEKEMSMVATDGHCLSLVKTDKYKLADPKKWLLPKRAVLELKKVLESASETENLFLGTCSSQLVFSGAHFNFFTKLIADPFPQYKPVMDKEGFLPAKIVKNSLVKTLKRSNCLLAGQFLSTNFTFKPGSLAISLHNKEVGKLKESVNLDKFEGEIVESRFYSPYLLSGLQAFAEEDVQFFIKNKTKPIIFEADEKDYHLTYLVMPVSASSGE